MRIRDTEFLQVPNWWIHYRIGTKWLSNLSSYKRQWRNSLPYWYKMAIQLVLSKSTLLNTPGRVNLKKSGAQYHEVPRKPVYLTLPFLGDAVSCSLSAEINKKFSYAFPSASLIIIFSCTKSFLCRIKDTISLGLNHDLVYRITCECNDTYIGKQLYN